MTYSYILVHQISFNLPTTQPIFNKLDLAFSKLKIGLVGKNGIGKSTLLKLIIGEIPVCAGSIQIEGKQHYVPQHFNVLPDKTAINFLDCEEKIKALHRILQGSVEEHDFSVLNEEWDIEERVRRQLCLFGLEYIPYDRPISLLSGGEKTRLLLVKAFLSNADFLLLDEPTNHLDNTARQQLYHAIQQWQGGLLVVSHDRVLLNFMDEIIELNTLGAVRYGGNYDEYEKQKEIEKYAKEQQLHDAKKLMQKTKNTIQSSREKHEKKQAYGRELRKSGSIDKLSANSKKGRSERTQSKLLIKEERLLHQAETKIKFAREKIEISEKIHIDLPKTHVPNGKVILDIEHLHFSYPRSTDLLIKDFDLKILGAERIAFKGDNGSGKTTLIKLLLNELKPQSGTICIGTPYVSYLDQQVGLLHPELSILENFLLLNPEAIENDAYRSLAQFLFRNVTALKLVKNLSGGEKLRAALACVFLSTHPPQLLILDEPTNHLDLDSIICIESALKNYQGAMIVISHDEKFLKNIGIGKVISAPFVK